MEEIGSEKLIVGNTAYLERFNARLIENNPGIAEQSVEEVIELVAAQLDPQVADIVLRHLLGQSRTVISDQLDIDLKTVSSSLAQAPHLISVLSVVPYREERYAMQAGLITADELLKMPVLPEYRLERILPENREHLVGAQMSLDLFAKRLGVKPDWVRGALRSMGITHETLGRNETFPAEYSEVLVEEYNWAELYSTLTPIVSLSTAADVLHRKQTWVYAKSIQLGTAPTREKIDRDREVMTIPKEILPQLRHVIFATPPSSYGFSMSELEEMSGQNDGWLRPRIEKAGIVPIFAEHVLHKRIVYIYPKDTLERVGGRVGHAGRKYTAHAMADLLGKNFDWVDPRLKRMNAESELLQDDNGRDALHYDEEIFFILKEEAELVKSYPEAGDWLAVNGLARAVGHSPAWVNRRLPFIVTESEIRVDSIKRPGLHFEPETSDRLLKLPADILKNALPASNE